MGLVITPLQTPRRFNPLAQPLEAAQNLGGRELVWRFDGGDITSDGGALALKKLEQRSGIVRRFAACFTGYRKSGQIARLRMSNIDASADSVEELEPIVARIRQRWPAVKICLRGDGGFCREKLMAWCERDGMFVCWYFLNPPDSTVIV